MTLQPGDLIAVYEYTRINPSQVQIHQWIAMQKAGNWWMPEPNEPHNRYPVWPDYPMVVLRVEVGVVFVTSSEFPEPLRSRGVRVPLTHIELLELGYGLPEMEPEERKVVPMAGRRNRKAVAAGQGVLL